MVDVNDFTQEKECTYKNEIYSVRDNGAVMRHAREGKKVRKEDNVWTFGKVSEKTGYMEICGQRVHRIVAYAFLGVPPTNQHVVDHIDTNRQNNRPENLRWLTKLENALNNPITRARIENICGSIEAFLSNPSILRGHERVDANFSWMRTVSPEEARISLNNLLNWAKERPVSRGGKIDEWIYLKDNLHASHSQRSNRSQQLKESISSVDMSFTKSLTPNAIQINWRIPSEFPCCPLRVINNALVEYKSKLEHGVTFCRNDIYSSCVYDSAIADDGNSLWVMCKSDGSIKPWSLTQVKYENNVFVHRSEGTYFGEDGALKYFTLAQGKDWTGGEVFDDYC